MAVALAVALAVAVAVAVAVGSSEWLILLLHRIRVVLKTVSCGAVLAVSSSISHCAVRYTSPGGLSYCTAVSR